MASWLGKLDSLWQNGVYVGYMSQSGEYMAVNEGGAYKTRAMKRRAVEDRWKKDRIEDIHLTPRKIKAGDEVSTFESAAQHHGPFLDIPVEKSIDLCPPSKLDEDPVPRRVYIIRSIFYSFGKPEACLGCLGSTVVPRSDTRGRRIESRMHDDP